MSVTLIVIRRIEFRLITMLATFFFFWNVHVYIIYHISLIQSGKLHAF